MTIGLSHSYHLDKFSEASGVFFSNFYFTFDENSVSR